MGTNLPPTYVDGFHDLEAVKRMPYTSLGERTNIKPSLLSFGGCTFGGLYDASVNLEDCKKTLEYAVQKGVNFIDTAPYYGNGRSETIFGKILPDIPRSAYYMATKIGRYAPEIDQMFDFSAQRVIKSVDESLERLNLDYVDLIQIHDLEFAPSLRVIIEETLPALQQVVAKGKAKHIGITGYPLSELKKVIELSPAGSIDTVLSYCRWTLIDSELEDYLPYFRSKGLGVINAAILSMGLLTDNGPQNWHPASKEIKDASVNAAKYAKDNGTNISRLAVHYSLLKNGPDTHLFSCYHKDALDVNLRVLQDKLTPEEQKTINFIEKNYFGSNLKQKHWENVEVNSYWEKRGGKPENS